MKEGKMSSKNERKKGLGRGLSSFLDVDSFGEIVDKKRAEKKVTNEAHSPTNLPIEHIIPNQNQPRKDFSGLILIWDDLFYWEIGRAIRFTSNFFFISFFVNDLPKAVNI